MEQEQRRPVGHMEYMEGMEQIDSDILAKVIAARNSYLAETYVDKDVKNALEHDVCTIEDFGADGGKSKTGDRKAFWQLRIFVYASLYFQFL